MRIFLLQWRFSTSDGYDNSEGMIGMYKTRKSAEEAGEAWLVEQDVEYYTCVITEVEVNE